MQPSRTRTRWGFGFARTPDGRPIIFAGPFLIFKYFTGWKVTR